MMDLIGGIIAIAGFALISKAFGLAEKSKEVLSLARSSAEIVRDAELDDSQKELALQSHAKRLFILFFVILSVVLVAIALPFALLGAMELAGLLSIRDVVRTTLSPFFLLVTALLMTVVLVISLRRQSE